MQQPQSQPQTLVHDQALSPTTMVLDTGSFKNGNPGTNTSSDGIGNGSPANDDSLTSSVSSDTSRAPLIVDSQTYSPAGMTMPYPTSYQAVMYPQGMYAGDIQQQQQAAAAAQAYYYQYQQAQYYDPSQQQQYMQQYVQWPQLQYFYPVAMNPTVFQPSAYTPQVIPPTATTAAQSIYQPSTSKQSTSTTSLATPATSLPPTGSTHSGTSGSVLTPSTSIQNPHYPHYSNSNMSSPPGLGPHSNPRSDGGVSNTDDNASATGSSDLQVIDGITNNTPLTSSHSSTTGADDAFFKGLLENSQTSAMSIRIPMYSGTAMIHPGLTSPQHHQHQHNHQQRMSPMNNSKNIPDLNNMFTHMTLAPHTQRYSMMAHGNTGPVYNRTNYPPSQRMITLLTEQVQQVLKTLRPSKAELDKKEELRKELEVLVHKEIPDARLEMFGSMGNGFAIANSDMDLCLLTDRKEKTASEYVELLGKVIKENTEYQVLTLPKARVPIIKLSRGPTDALPTGIQIDIGFNNRVALVNTKLLNTYRQIDQRLEDMVLFIKYWVKRRRINHPHSHTLSSYTYVLLTIYFLQIQDPPVLPNLQQMPMRGSLSLEEVETEEGYSIAFCDDIQQIRDNFKTSNTKSVGLLLYEFFHHFANDFRYSTDVISIRCGGVCSKESKGWTRDVENFIDEDTIVKDRYRLAVEDPFETSHNTARTVNREGLFVIRGEFLRSVKRVIGKGDWREMVGRLCEPKTEEDEEMRLREARMRFIRHPDMDSFGETGNMSPAVPNERLQSDRGENTSPLSSVTATESKETMGM